MGQVPCSCQTHCEPLVDSENSSTTVKVDRALLQILDEACLTPKKDQEYLPEKTRSYCVARDKIGTIGPSGAPPSPLMQRCPARQTSEDQALRRLAMTVAAHEVAQAAAAQELQSQKSPVHMMDDLQAQQVEASMNHVFRDSLQRVEDSTEVDLDDEHLNDLIENEYTMTSRMKSDPGCLPVVWEESVSQEAADEQEEAREKADKLKAEIEQAKQESANYFLVAEGFASVNSIRRKSLGTSVYPLHVAVERNDAEVVRCLLFARADPTQKTVRPCALCRRQTPKEMAARRNRRGSHAEVLSVLDAAVSCDVS